MKKVVLGMVLLFGLGAVAQQAGPPPGLEIPTNLKSYFVVFYLKNANSEKAHDDLELMKKHTHYVRGLTENGKIVMAGPYTDEGRIAGMFILTAQSADDAKNVVSGDPIVTDHMVDVEVHSAMLPDLSAVKVVYPPKTP